MTPNLFFNKEFPVKDKERSRSSQSFVLLIIKIYSFTFDQKSFCIKCCYY